MRKRMREDSADRKDPLNYRHGLTLLVVLFGLLAAPSARASRVEEIARSSGDIVQSVLAGQSPAVSSELIEDTRCLAVFPRIRHAAFGLGGRRGLGVVSCRDRRGQWSPPAYLRLTAGSVGFQLGFQQTELLLFFLSDKAKESLIEPQMALGGDVHIAGGERSHAAGVSTDPRLRSEVYLFEKSAGAFIGASVGGQETHIAPKAMEDFYGQPVAPRDVLFDHQVPRVPAAAEALMGALSRLPYREPEIKIIDEAITPDPSQN